MSKKSIVLTVSIVFFLISYGILSFFVFYYGRSIILLILLGIIGIILYFSCFFGDEWENKSILMIIYIGFAVSFGLIFGAILNDISIPLYLYFFFFGVLTLQFSKDILKSCKRSAQERSNNEEYRFFADIFGLNVSQKIVLILQFLTILFLLIPFVTGIYNYFLYLFPMLIAMILIVISVILNLVYDFEEKYNGKVFILLRIGMFFVIVAYFFGSI
ncbi:MAG: hypothetical protein ACQERB_08785 [Promethearchaeati archaeon]